MSGKYPDIMDHMKLAPKAHVKSFVLDSEAVAWDSEKNCILPFQILSTRKRKDVSTEDIRVHVCVFAFDLLYLNGESLIRHTFQERRELLRSSFNVVDGKFQFAKHMDSKAIEDIQTFLDESIEGNCEGLMVKTLVQESSYEPSKRSRNWLKVKKDYLDGAGDSLDLVVIGGYTGKGERTGVYGGFFLLVTMRNGRSIKQFARLVPAFLMKTWPTTVNSLSNMKWTFLAHTTTAVKE
jgi:DNA ligase-1